MHRIAALIFLIGIASPTMGQNAKAELEAGDRAFTHGIYDQAAAHYQKALAYSPNDHKILFKLGVTLLSTNKKFEALDPLLKANEQKKDVNPEIDFYIGQAYQQRLQFKEALEHFRAFKIKHKKLSAIADQHIEQCILADSLVKTPSALAIEILPNPINTKFHEYAPLIDSGESIMIFTTARDSTKKDIRSNNQFFESVMFSEKLGGNWSEPALMGKEINHEAHDAATYISPDGNTLVLYYGDSRNLFTSKFSSGGYKSEIMNGVWSKAEPLPAPINSISWESSGCFSPDGKFFIFSSDRSEGYGELDLYMTKLQSDGTWGKPENLGPEINTPANEDAPFMHSDGTLYFGSEGLPGIGDYDIFKTRYRNGKWQKPENLGFPVNSPSYDNYFQLSADKKHGYFTSIREEGFGNTDIYMATFPESKNIDLLSLAIKQRADSIARADSLRALTAKPRTMSDADMAKNAYKIDSLVNTSFVDKSIKEEFHVATEFRGKVLDEVNGKPVYAQIVLVDNKTGKLLTRAYTNPKTGSFLIIIPHGGNFGVSANADGYLFNSMNFDVPAFSESHTLETAMLMSKMAVGAKSTLRNIFFDSGKSQIKTESNSELDRIVNLLTTYENLRVNINGHTDNLGDNATNMVLSQKRAQAVVDYLISKGISASRLKAVGFGEERPLATNDDEREGREINRRTEIEVVAVTK